MAVLIDTAIFVAIERRRVHWREALDGEVPGENLAIAAITASELLAGIYRADTPQRRSEREANVESILAAVPALPFGLHAARVHARLWAELTAAGNRIGQYDSLIAATALAHDYALLTENVREFGRIPGLELRQPAWQ